MDILEILHKYDRQIPKVQTDDNVDVIVISDLHVPFHIQEVIDFIIAEYSDRESAYLVINGDLMDATSISSFPHGEKHSVFDEVIKANELVKQLAQYFLHVFILDGNHERRLSRYIWSNAKPLTEFFPETLNYYVARNIDINHGMVIDNGQLENVTYIPAKYVIFNNVCFMHPINYSSVPGGTVKKAIEDAVSHGIPFDVMVIGHTHKIAYINHLGKVGIETGCLTAYDDYITKFGRLTQASQIGFLAMKMQSGICISTSLQNLSYIYNASR